MSSLGRGSNEEKKADNGGAADEDGDDESGKRVPGKKKKKRSKILESNPAAIRLKQLEIGYPTDPLDQYYASVFDVANTSGLLINHLSLCKDGLTVRYHSEIDSTLPDNVCSAKKRQEMGAGDAAPGIDSKPDEEQKKEYQREISDRLAELGKLHEALKAAHICPSGIDFKWDQPHEDIFSGDDGTDPSTQSTDEKSLSEHNTEEEEDVVMDSAPMEDDLSYSEPAQNVPLGKQELPAGIDEQLITSFAPGEYSYFRSGVVSTWEGPNHWKVKLQGKVPSAISSEKSAHPEQAKGTKRKKKFFIDYHSLNIDVDEEGFERSNKSTILTRRMRDKLKAMTTDRLLPTAGEYSLPDLTKCSLQSQVRINPIALIRMKRDEVEVDTEQLGIYNYDNPNDKNNYCPNMTDDDGGDFDAGDDIPADFATDYTNTEGNSNTFPDMSQSQPQSQLDIEAMLKGDHLISHPRKVEKISIAYAKKATRIDVRRLKSAMWNVLHSQSMNTSRVPETTDNTTETPTVEDSLPAALDKKTFSDMYYQELPGLMPLSMSENLSIPLAFTCLLHLANEKSLSISADSDMSDLNIELCDAGVSET